MPSPTQIDGQRFEDLAEEILTRAGYRIVSRNWRGGRGELDRIAWHASVLVFVEIRARKSSAHGLPSETVRTPKQRRLITAAVAYLAAHGPRPLPEVRFDVVSIVEHGPDDLEVELIPGAFDAGASFGARGIPMV